MKPAVDIVLRALPCIAGCGLFLWYRTVVKLPGIRRPVFVRFPLFKWGVPAIALLLFLAGTGMLARISYIAAAIAAAACALISWAVIHFDRYFAEMRMIHAYYCRIRESRPGMGEDEALYNTARWRYPDWSHDRLAELVAGKDIEGLILLILIHDNGIHPISDWELYRSLKARAAAIAGGRRKGA